MKHYDVFISEKALADMESTYEFFTVLQTFVRNCRKNDIGKTLEKHFVHYTLEQAGCLGNTLQVNRPET